MRNKEQYFLLSEQVSKVYNVSQGFVLGVVLDNYFRTKWETIKDKPAIDNLEYHELNDILYILEKCIDDPEYFEQRKSIHKQIRNGLI